MPRIYLNDNWKFSEAFTTEMIAPAYDETAMETVRLPHTVREVPLHYFDEALYQMVSGYRRSFTADPAWQGKRVFLTVEAAAHEATLYVNGQEVLTHSCGYTAFTAELTEMLDYDKANVITVRCDSRESLNVPPFGHVVDYMTFGGLYREVYLEVREQDFIADVYGTNGLEIVGSTVIYQPRLEISLGSLRTENRENGPEDEEEIDLAVEDSIFALPGYRLLQELYTMDGSLVDSYEMNEIRHMTKHVELWSIEHPVRYRLKTILYHEQKEVDVREDVIAFRKTEFKADGFYLNDVKVKLRGLNRHQSFPYVGYAMPESMQRQDADILKYELGCNVTRTSHYPQSHDFIDECDRIGLLVFMEFPGWQHIGDDAWKEQTLVNEREMILQYRNHPSIMIWGVRINESADDDAFYERTNALAHELDRMRQTGGVRAMQKGHLLEDVYTYNDFLHDGTNAGCQPKKKVTPDQDKGYLVTEYNGHMYPTKAYDWEEHRLTHALRHAAVLDSVIGQKDIAGCIGWCMFDYNTHKDFGSGDRICYHGVMDMFRNPKSAAAIYASFGEKEPVLELSSTMDIGEHPGCNRGNTYIFTNADSVKMYKNDIFIKEFTAKDSPYKNLPHGPILIDDFIGDEIHKNEKFTKHQADIIKEGLNYVTLHGYHFPPRIVAIAVECMLVYHMKPIEAVQLYNRYIGDWGGETKGYRFEAIRKGKVVKTIVKQPMKTKHLSCRITKDVLTEGRTYDVTELRLQMLDENDNLLYFDQEPLRIKTEGPIECIGPELVGLEGGMTGLYIKSTGEAGEARVTVSAEGCESITIPIHVKVDPERMKTRA